MSKTRVIVAVCSVGLLAAFIGGCSASAKIGTPEVKAATPPPPPPAPPPPPPPPPVEAKPAVPIKAMGKAKIENNEIKIPGKIQFDIDKATLKETKETTDILKTVADVMKENKQITKLRVEGHTDDKGGTEHNVKLSEGRAQTVADWLVKNGVEKERIATIGFGEARPINANDNDANREKNRRTEFKVWQVDGKDTDVVAADTKLPGPGAAPGGTVAATPAAGTKPATGTPAAATPKK